MYEKRYFGLIGILVSVLVAICLVSCSNDDVEEDEPIWDFSPVIVGFEVVSPDGTNLIAEGEALYESDFRIKYREKEFSALWTSPTNSRYYRPYFRGLFYFSGKDTKSNPQLMFGELDGNLGSASLDFILPNGESHQVYISRTVTTQFLDCTVRQTVKLDGKILDEYTDGSAKILLTIVVGD